MSSIRFSAQSLRTTDSPITYFIQKAISTPGLISLAAGLVDESSFPSAEVASVVQEIMTHPASARAALQYGSTQGLPSLREQILQHICSADGVSSEEVNLSREDVVLTTGSQQLLYLLGEALFDPGDIVICEGPSYFVYHGVLQTRGVRTMTVPLNEGGLDLRALEKLLVELQVKNELHKLKLIYTVDYFQNPTGLSLAEDRREALLKLVQRFSVDHRIMILEDAAYRELRYQDEDTPSIKRYDTTNEYVIYTSTFSKPCAPGLKTGYALLPKDLVGPICNLKGNHDFGSANLAQHILDRLMRSGAYDRHVNKLREVYRQKRDVMLSALADEFADWPEVRWTTPGGGLYVWLSLPSHINTGPSGDLVERALQEGVLYVPGEFGHVPDALGHVPQNEARLSFGVSTPEQIREGIVRLRNALRGMEGHVVIRKPVEALV